jgi:uncharacterized protein (DUF362 family)
MSRVVIIRVPGLTHPKKLSFERIQALYTKAFSLLSLESGPSERLFHTRDRVGIKINTLGGKRISTRREISEGLASHLCKTLQARNITIWDRSNQELKNSGYKLSTGKGSWNVMGTDTRGIGYGDKLAVHRSIGSLFSEIQARITSSISLAILKDHGLAGVTAGMKNYFGAIHNPNKYHDSGCDPFIADLFDYSLIKKKHRLTILDCLLVQYHRGPAFHPQWAAPYEAVIFSLDAVAADYTGWTIIEKLRAEKGLPSLKEDLREPSYILTAEKMGLGTANPDNITIVEGEA